MPHEPRKRKRQPGTIGQPVFLVFAVSIVLAAVFLIAMMSLANDSLFNGGLAGSDRTTLEENAPPVDRTLRPTPPENAPLTERIAPGSAPVETPAESGSSASNALERSTTGNRSVE